MSIYRVGCRWADDARQATADREVLDVFIRLGIVFTGKVEIVENFKKSVKPDDILLITGGTYIKAIAVAQSTVRKLSDFDITDLLTLNTMVL